MFEPSGSGAGSLVLAGGDRRRGRPEGTRPGTTTPGETDEPAEVIALADLDAGADAVEASTRQRAREIAQRLAVPAPRRDRAARRAVGKLASLPYRGAADEIDLDRTLENLAGKPFPEDEDVVVRERIRQRRSVVLVVDVSGSMKGERVRTAAAAVGALAGELAHDRLAVVAFWSDAAVLARLGEPVEPLEILDTLLRVPAQGLTNVSFALEVAGRQLAGVLPRDARVLLLSDAVHNAGPDPRAVAARLPRLDVLLDTSGEKDVDLGRDLARAGRGQLRLIRDHRDVAGALSAVFAD
ncbi:Mg-chelatase subunit ChlD [Blastococcus aggregatus]|uniref:Mg-chelatase subunit ChlD n=1 Tax=Blastococcus aggregatus TaxID=38502 RepID=A0A285VBF9_9ACTN|nr:vWA domain-containing protein [Blastococcus aggregatus]SOC51424.1 Mg-chelatase subunit ChlD [Blastococcus aggregatus]